MGFISKIRTPSNSTYELKYGVYPVNGTQTSATNVWTGNIDVASLYDGLTIAYYLPYAGTATGATLNLTLNNNQKTGAVPIYYTGNTANTNMYGAGSTILLTYWSAGSISIDGTATTTASWRRADYNTNSTYSNASLGNGYGTCATAAATTAKVVTLSSYSLVINGFVSVKFTYDVPASATLNINSKGAKSIKYKGENISANIIKGGDTATFVYDGTNYHLIAIDKQAVEIPTAAEVGAVPTSRTVNGKALSSDISLTASDVGALPSSTTIPTATTTTPKMDGTASVGSETKWAKGDHVHPSDTSRVPTTRKVNNKALNSDITLTASDVGALPDDTEIPSKTSDLTNDSGFINSPNIPYLTCATAAATAAKTTTLVIGTFTSDDLVAGAQVLVNFTYENGVANPTLSVNGTTAKSIKRYGTTAPSTSAASSWNAGAVVLFIYDGTYWQMEAWENTTYTTITSAEVTAGTSTSSRLVTPALLKTAVQTFADENVIETVKVNGVALTPDSDKAVDIIETDPTVPAWAKASTKPTYTAAEVGAVPTTRKVNNKELSSNITLSASDVSAVPITRKVNNKALSTDITLTASDVSAVATSAVGAASGVAPLNSSSKIDSTYLPSYVDDVIEGYYYNSKFYTTSAHTTEIPGESGKIFVDLTTNKTYRYSGTTFTEISQGSVVTVTRNLTSGTKVGTITVDGTGTDLYAPTNTDTWRAVQVNGTQVLGTSTSTNALNLKDGTNIGLSNSSGTVTFNHGTSGATAGSYGSATQVPSITVDAQGHVTAVSNTTITGVTPASHSHGNITNGGDITSASVTIANKDAIVINDDSASKLANGPVFDGSTTTKALTPKGTWETFLQSHQSLAGYVPTSRTINSKALTSDITLTASDVGAASSTHTHTTTIAAGGTSQLNLSANTAYTLTSGGTTYVFKTPADSDTKNTTGSTDTSSEIYLVGATTQAANPQTYSHDTARVRANGMVASSGYEFATASAMGTTKATMVYDSTIEAIAFQFA